MKLKYLLVFVCFNAFGQETANFEKYKKKYPNSHSLRLNQETKLTIERLKGEFVIKQETIEEDLFLDDSATYNSKQSISFSSFYELEDINASSYVLRNGEYEEFLVKDFKEKDDLDNSFYDDSKSINYIYPNLNQGGITKLKYTQNILDPRFLNSFFLGNFYPIEYSKYVIEVDKDVVLDFVEINMDNIPVIFDKKESRKKIIYTWELKNIKEYEFEANAPTYKGVLPHIIPLIKSYKEGDEEISVLGNVSDLYKWYYSLVKDINKEEPTPELVNVVKDLIANKKNDLEKVRAIYYWTQENIKYIAFEYALGGFIPREANDIFRKKYGDCKDNSSLLLKMLEIAGLKGHLTWIGTRSIPYKYEQVPTPIVDNHMILSFEFKGEFYFLDATGRYTSLEIPTSFIQGKEALIGIDANTFKVIEVPTIEPNKNVFIDKTQLRLNGQGIKGESTTTISGYGKINDYYSLEKRTTKEKIKDYYNAKFQKGNNSFLIKEVEEINKYSYDDDLIVNYNFEINNYCKIIGEEVYLNLNLNKKALEYKTKKNRESSIEYDYKNYFEYQTELHIPESYSVEYLPDNFSMSNNYLSSSITYTLEENKILYKHTLKHNFLELNLGEQKIVNDAIAKVEKEYKEVLILRKN